MFSSHKLAVPDKKHLHHILMESGYGHKRSVLMLYCISGIMCVASMLIVRDMYYEAAFLAIIVCVFIYVFLTDPAHSGNRGDKKNKKK